MTATPKSILLIAPDSSVAEALAKGFSHDPEVRIDTELRTLAAMNGKAVRAMESYDLIMFQTRPDDPQDLAAIRTLAAQRRSDARLVALADGNISLSDANMLRTAGVDEVLPLPGSAARRTPAGSARPGHLIVVAQARGGVGSTTVAVNLADRLVGGEGLVRNRHRNKVALLDFDFQFGTVGSFLDLPEQDTLLKIALDGIVPDENFLRQSLTDLPNGLSVLAAPSRFAPLDSLRPEQVAAIIDTLRASHDYIVVDLPRALVGWIEPIVQRADELMIVTDLSVPSVRHCRRLIDFFTQDHMALPVKIVVNHRARPFLKSRLDREAAKVLERPLDHWLPHHPAAAIAAADRGQPLSAVAPYSSLSRAFRRLAKSTLAQRPKAGRQE
jgi:pilus assembly protein CpaE